MTKQINVDEMDKETRAMFDTLSDSHVGLEFSVGSSDQSDVVRIARQWIDAGFSASQALKWLKAGCFVASDAAKLRDSGLRPEQVAGDSTVEGESWGYAYANGDVSLAKVLEACAERGCE